jgi:hypothetical protein
MSVYAPVAEAIAIPELLSIEYLTMPAQGEL